MTQLTSEQKLFVIEKIWDALAKSDFMTIDEIENLYKMMNCVIKHKDCANAHYLLYVKCLTQFIPDDYASH